MGIRHIVSADDLDAETLATLFARAAAYKQLKSAGSQALAGQSMASVFYEPSTRTRFSFEAAMAKLGGTHISTENAEIFSSAAKGESLEDAIRVISGYVDLIVLRHKEEGIAARAAAVSSVPIINAGDGKNEHPTQAFLDLFTLWECGNARDLRHVLFFGDNRRGRTVNSLARLLATRAPALGITIEKVSFCGANSFGESRPETRELLEQHGIGVEFCAETPPSDPDVVYVTRSQKERVEQGEAGVNSVLVLSPVYAENLPTSAIIMHPLPRTEELPVAIDMNPRARYFVQARNGLYVRMALLEWVAGR